MRYILVISLCVLLQTKVFSQWKSFYPEQTVKATSTLKVDKDRQKEMFENYLFSALKAKALEDYDVALKNFDECIKIDKTHPLAFYESALINSSIGQHDVSLEQIKKAVDLDSQNRWFLLLYAEILFKKQDFTNSAKQYRKLISLEPGNEELYYKLSDTYIYANQLEKAIMVYQELQNYKGPEKMLSMQKYKLYRELNNIKGAIKELVFVQKEYPDDVEVIELLAELHLLNDEKEKAFSLFKKIAVMDPNNGRIHLTLADYYRQNGENEQSYNELKLAFGSPQLNIDIKIRVLISYFSLISIDQIMKDQAYELVEILIKTHPDDVRARAVYADILYTDNKYQKAKEQYLLVLEKDKSKIEVWSQVLFIQVEQNNFEEILKTSYEALEYFPTEALFYYFNGVANKYYENYDEAITSLKNGVEFVLENQNLLIEIYSSLADIFHKVDQHDISDGYFEKGLEIDSNNTVILNNYSYYLSLRKTNLEKARRMSLRCNKIEPNNGTYQDTYAWILYSMNRYDEAEQWMLKAMLNGGIESAVVVEHYGDILYRLGKTNEAKSQWKKAMEMGGKTNFLEQKVKDGILYE